MTIPAPLFAFAQAIIGCLVARVLPPSTLSSMARDWPTFVGGVLSVVMVSVALGWALTRLRVLPGTTAVWGAFPGAATVMTLMSEGYGADVRLVALMQYLRVVMVTVVATGIAAVWNTATPRAAAAVVWFAPVAWGPLAETIALAAAAAAAGWAFRLPAGPLLVALGAAAVLQDLGVMTVALPPWLLAPAYCLVGWSIGARFNRAILIHAARVLPALAASILSLIAACGLLAAALAHFAHVDALTAYLATSPGGAEFGGDHLRIEPGRHALHHGDAGGAVSRRPHGRPGDRPFRCDRGRPARRPVRRGRPRRRRPSPRFDRRPNLLLTSGGSSQHERANARPAGRRKRRCARWRQAPQARGLLRCGPSIA